MHYRILKDGVVHGGWAEYAIFSDNHIRYVGNIELRALFVSMDKDFSGSYTADPGVLDSAAYRTVGTQEKIESVSLEVLEVDGDRSRVSVKTDDGVADGEVWVITSGPQIVLQSAAIGVSAYGFKSTVRLEKE